ncbi:MFS transporter [Actinomyces sp. oral taxon 897]|uniref:MFS transporter n=1 Tax=Actinomyces sp. oral taxon 897 TaxID=2081702 RepID=UPI000D02B348|nr:MFS transporter [Actinomyces sp. oral taxon 897]AVM62192.1 MFS transporter [Actinomyces sp. oral taxon 897]
MRLRDDLRDLAASRGLRILLATRLISQTGDGMVQVGLVTLFFFAPQNATSTGDVAAALVVMLLPFSVVGPFTGPFIDRFRRRSTLMTMNLVRAGLILTTAVVIRGAGAGVVVYLLVLAALGVNRFLLATLAASLPHVVDADRLLTANSLVPTLGGAATAAGAVIGLLLRLTLPADAQDVASLLTAAGLYVASAGVVSRLGRDELGPDWLTRARSTGGGAAGAAGAGTAGAFGAQRRSEPEDTARGLGTTGTGTTGTVRDLADAVRHLLSRRTPALALGVMGAYRLVYGLELVTIILASRNLLADPADADAGLAVFGTLMGAMLVGHGLAVVLTPLAQERVSPPTWVVACLLGGSLGQVLLVAGHTREGMAAGLFVFGVGVQGAKIAVDTIVQTDTSDDYRGRAFSLYDVLFNAAECLAAGVAVLVMPDVGWSRGVQAALVAAVWVVAPAYRWSVRRWGVHRCGGSGRGPECQRRPGPRYQRGRGPGSGPGAVVR